MKNKCRFLALNVILIVFLATACGEKRRASPPPPCGVGVDQKSCGIQITGPSRWLRHYNVYESEEDKKNNRFDTQVDIITEFNRLEDGTDIWRRSLTYTTVNETPKTMFLYGKVDKLTDDEIHLSLESSTCDGVDRNFYIDSVGSRQIYYSRLGGQLLFQKNRVKIESSGGGGVGDIFGKMIVTAVATMFEQLVDGTIDAYKKAFSFGVLRDQMSGGFGQFEAVSDQALYDSRFAYGQIGCFVARDGKFKIGSEQPIIPKW